MIVVTSRFDNRNEILEAEGVVPDYEDGIRITDAKTLQIARVSFLVCFVAFSDDSESSSKRISSLLLLSKSSAQGLDLSQPESSLPTTSTSLNTVS